MVNFQGREVMAALLFIGKNLYLTDRRLGGTAGVEEVSTYCLHPN
jgi:hypothetical protein